MGDDSLKIWFVNACKQSPKDEYEGKRSLHLTDKLLRMRYDKSKRNLYGGWFDNWIESLITINN